MHWTLDYVRALDAASFEEVLSVIDGFDTARAHEGRRRAERTH